MLELLSAYGAGLLTLINPCVLPVLPIVLASALQGSRLGPVYLAAGMSVSFVALGLFVTTLGQSIGLTEDRVAQIGAMLMIVFGIVLLTPAFERRFATATAGFAQSADHRMDQLDARSAKGQLLGGILLGAVWSPCIGPTLGGAIALASQGQSLGWVTLIMVCFALGVSTLILALAYGSREAIRARQASLRAIADKTKPLMGIIFIAVGVMILTRFHHVLEGWALDHLPYWLQDLSVAL